MCSAEGSAHVLKKFCCLFLQSLTLKSITGNMGGTEFSHIFPPQYQEMQLPGTAYTAIVQQPAEVRVMDTVTSLRLNWRAVWNISDGQERQCIHLFPFTSKKPLFLGQTGKGS